MCWEVVVFLPSSCFTQVHQKCWFQIAGNCTILIHFKFSAFPTILPAWTLYYYSNNNEASEPGSEWHKRMHIAFFTFFSFCIWKRKWLHVEPVKWCRLDHIYVRRDQCASALENIVHSDLSVSCLLALTISDSGLRDLILSMQSIWDVEGCTIC